MRCTAPWCADLDEKDVDVDGTVSHLCQGESVAVADVELRLWRYVALKPDGVYEESVKLDVCGASDTPLDMAGVIELRNKLGDLLLDMIPSTP